MNLHTVHMNDGTKRLCTPEELEALDPATWHVQECPRPRYEVRPNALSPETTVYSVYDWEDQSQVKHVVWGYTTESLSEAENFSKELNGAH